MIRALFCMPNCKDNTVGLPRRRNGENYFSAICLTICTVLLAWFLSRLSALISHSLSPLLSFITVLYGVLRF